MNAASYIRPRCLVDRPTVRFCRTSYTSIAARQNLGSPLYMDFLMPASWVQGGHTGASRRKRSLHCSKQEALSAKAIQLAVPRHHEDIHDHFRENLGSLEEVVALLKSKSPRSLADIETRLHDLDDAQQRTPELVQHLYEYFKQSLILLRSPAIANILSHVFDQNQGKMLDSGDRSLQITVWSMIGRLEDAEVAFDANIEAVQPLKSSAVQILLQSLLDEGQWGRCLAIWEKAYRYAGWVGGEHGHGGTGGVVQRIVSSIPEPEKYLLARLQQNRGSGFLRRLIREAIICHQHSHLRPQLFDLIRAAGSTPSKEEYRELMGFYIKRMDFERVIDLFDRMKNESQIVPDSKIFNFVLRALGHQENYGAMQRTFEYMFSVGQNPNEYAYSVVMTAFAKKGMSNLVEALYQQYQARGLPDNPYIFSALILARVVRGDKAKAVIWFHKLKDKGLKENIVCYNIVINLYAKEASIDEALDLLVSLWNNGILPDAFTISALTAMFGRRGDVESAQQLKTLADSIGCGLDVHINTSLLAAYSKAGNVRKAEEFLDSLNRKGLDLGVAGWNTILHGYVLLGQFEDFNRVMGHMRRSRIFLDARSYAIILQSLVFRGRMTAATQVLCKLHLLGVKVDEVHYSIVMAGFLREGRYDLVQQYYNRMTEEGLRPTFYVYALLLSAYARQNTDSGLDAASSLLDQIDKEKVLDIRSSFLPRDALPPELFTPLVQAFGEKQMYEAANALYRRFLNQVVEKYDGHSTIGFLCSMVTLFAKEGNAAQAEDTFRRIQHCAKLMLQSRNVFTGQVVILQSKRHLMCKPLSIYMPILFESGGRDAVERLWSELEASGFQLDSTNYNDFIVLLCLHGQIESACELAQSNLIKWRQTLDHRWRLFPKSLEVLKRVIYDASTNGESSQPFPSFPEGPSFTSLFPVLSQALRSNQ